MKIMLMADLHLADRPPSSCTESYQDDLFDLLRQASGIADCHGVKCIVIAGDVFHIKAPSRVSHRLVHRLCNWVEEVTDAGIDVLVVAGNHDMANDRVESVWDTQPLGMVLRAGAFDLRGWCQFAPVYGVPWLQGYGSGPVDGIERKVEEALEEYRDQVFGRGTGSEKPLVVTHAPLYPPGQELIYEYFPAQSWVEAMSSPVANRIRESHGCNGGGGAVFYGHVHEPHGVYTVGGVTFCNNGSLSRGSLHEYQLTRQVGVTIYDSLIGEFEFVPLDAKPASEVFRLTEKQQAVDVQGRLDDFLETAGSAMLEVCTVESIVAHVRSLGIAKPVQELVEQLLQEASHD